MKCIYGRGDHESSVYCTAEDGDPTAGNIADRVSPSSTAGRSSTTSPQSVSPPTHDEILSRPHRDHTNTGGVTRLAHGMHTSADCVVALPVHPVAAPAALTLPLPVSAHGPPLTGRHHERSPLTTPEMGASLPLELIHAPWSFSSSFINRAIFGLNG